MSEIFDEELKVSFKYVDLVDSKTILKEIFDNIRAESKKGNMVFSDVQYDAPIEDRIKKLKTVHVYQIFEDNRRILLGKGTAAIKIDAEQKAAANSIVTMNGMGYSKDPPPIYEELHNEYFM